MNRSRVSRCGTAVREPDPRDELLERGVPFATFEAETLAWCAGYLRALRELDSPHPEDLH